MPKTVNMSKRRQLIAGTALLGAPFLWSRSARAADPSSYPSKLITIVVPQAPGGANDVIGRALAQRLSAVIGGPVIVENRQGAGGNLGTAYVARQPKDGHTLLLNAQSVQTINPFLYRKVPFDPVKDFDPVMVVGVAPYMLAVNPAVPAKNLRELVALAKASPGKFNYASAGNGTVNHLLGEMLKNAAGIDIVHVPYRGAAAAATDVVAGQVPMTFGSLAGLMPFVRSGQLRTLGVCTEKRTQLAPDLPTLAETIPGLYANAWYGLFAPAGTPKEIIARLNTDIIKLMDSPEMRERLVGLGVEAAPGTPDQLATLMREDLVRWSKIVKDSGAQLD
jgi:tripartite-type tricarboxylate transporter receptor subunit TctC